MLSHEYCKILKNTYFGKHLWTTASCFVILSHFVIVKDFELFWGTTLLKRDSNTGVFLWILRNFLKHLFWRTSVNYCFLFCLIESFRSSNFLTCHFLSVSLMLEYLRNFFPDIIFPKKTKSGCVKNWKLYLQVEKY